MEVIEDKINNFFEQWEYYCYPDKAEKCRAQVDEFLKEIDQLQDETSRTHSMQAKARKNKKPSCSTCEVRYSTFYPHTKNRQKSFSTKAYLI
jgi:hypothetical protein